jgi:TctA family transporter
VPSTRVILLVEAILIGIVLAAVLALVAVALKTDRKRFIKDLKELFGVVYVLWLVVGAMVLFFARATGNLPNSLWWVAGMYVLSFLPSLRTRG